MRSMKNTASFGWVGCAKSSPSLSGRSSSLVARWRACPSLPPVSSVRTSLSGEHCPRNGGIRDFGLPGLVGALLTSLYTFRLIFRVFSGPLGTPVTKRPGYAMTVPLLVLAFFSIVAGYLKQPLLDFLRSVLPPTMEAPTGALTEIHSEA